MGSLLSGPQAGAFLDVSNNYEGPPENFALVVPVPVVIKEADVKTLDRGLFERID